MTPLRQKMIEDMQLRGLAERTQQSYVAAVVELARYYDKSPEEVSEAELRGWFLYLKNEKKVAPSTLNQKLSALKFFYQTTLQTAWPLGELVKPERRQSLPVVLSREEVGRVLTAVRQPQYRVCLLTIYSCGLRLQEGVGLPVKAIDSSRRVLHIKQGKGGKDRLVPLPERTLAVLRRHWQTHRNREWLFPRRAMLPSRPLDVSGVQKAFRAAVQASGVGKEASVHTLRHSYATHLVEAGVNLELVQRYLGHKTLQTTLRYVHLTPQRQETALAQINQIMAGLP
jgi:integrase/recombinase XerD